MSEGQERMYQPSTQRVFQPIPADVERIGKVVLNAAFKVHSTLGPGLLESVYQVAMKHALEKSGVGVKTDVKLPILFEGIKLDSGLQLDLLVEKCVIVELKSVERMSQLYQKQLLTYLRLSRIRLGFLINFNVPYMKDGIKRMVA